MLRLQVKNIIKKSKLTITKNRKKILSVFLNAERPLSLKEIRLLIIDIDRTTLFRILSVFEEKKVIHIINMEGNNKLYALCHQECNVNRLEHRHKHIHFKCDDCNNVTCLSINKFPQLNVPNYMINNLNINASGICVNCKK